MIKKFVVGMNETNSYVVYDEDTLEAVIIDPGEEEKTIIQFISKKSLKPLNILLTHFHYDHIGAAEELKKKYGCPISIHKSDVKGLADPQINHSQKNFRKPVSIVPDQILRNGDIIKIGNISLKIIHTPGHTKGSICIMMEEKNIIFTGDTIFDDDLGRTDLVGGNYDSLKNSIINKLSKWEDIYLLYPGHGKEALMEEIKRKNVRFIQIIGKQKGL